MVNRKISEFTLLTSGQVARASDYLPIIDASEGVSSMNKRITVEDLATAIFGTPAISLGGTLTVPGNVTVTSGVFTITAPADTISPVLHIKGDNSSNQIHIGGDEFGAYLDSYIGAATPPWPNSQRHEWYITGSLVELWIVDSNVQASRGLQVAQQAGLGAATSVNYLSVSPAPTGVAPRLLAKGSDTNVGLNLITQGTGGVEVFTNTSTRQFVVGHTASAVNYLHATGAATSGHPVLSAVGSDANIVLRLNAKGAGYFQFEQDASAIAYIAAEGSGASARKYLQFTGTAGARVIFGGASGDLIFNSSDSGIVFIMASVASAVNYLSAASSSAGNSVSLGAAGSDTNIDIAITPKGSSGRLVIANNTGGLAVDAIATISPTATPLVIRAGAGGTAGKVQFTQNNSFGQIALQNDAGANGLQILEAGDIYFNASSTRAIYFSTNDSVSNKQFKIAHVASAVNYLEVRGGGTGGGTRLQAQGSDTNIDVKYVSKGGWGHSFFTAGDTLTLQFSVAHTASAVNYPEVKGGITGSPAVLQSSGTDTDVDLALYTKGAGVLRFGTRTAIGAETVTGYITIKDSGGTTRKLAVVS